MSSEKDKKTETLLILTEGTVVRGGVMPPKPNVNTIERPQAPGSSVPKPSKLKKD